MDTQFCTGRNKRKYAQFYATHFVLIETTLSTQSHTYAVHAHTVRMVAQRPQRLRQIFKGKTFKVFYSTTNVL